MASDGSGLSSDPSSTGTAAHFGQRAPDNVRAGAGSGGSAAAPAVSEPAVADENDIGSAGPDTSQVIELAAVGLDYAPLRTRSASATRSSPASQRSAGQRGRAVGDVDIVRVDTTPGGSSASRTTAGGAGPVSPLHRLPDPSRASPARDGGGSPPLDPCRADPNTYRDGVQSKSPNPPKGDTPVMTGSSGCLLYTSPSPRDRG